MTCKCATFRCRNLSYGRQNDENKRAIKNAGGITALVRYVKILAQSIFKRLIEPNKNANITTMKFLMLFIF